MGSCCSHGKTRLNRGPVPNLRNSAGNAATNTNCSNYDQARQRVSFGELPDTNKVVRVSNQDQGVYANGTNGNNQVNYTVNSSAMIMPTLEQSPIYTSLPNAVQTMSNQQIAANSTLQQQQQLNGATNSAAAVLSPTIANGVMHHDDLSNENAIVREVDANDTHLRHERLFSIENARDHGIVPGMSKYANMQSFPHGNINTNNHDHDDANEDSMEMESIASTSQIEVQNAGFTDNNNNDQSDDEDTGSSDMPSALSATTSPAVSNTNSATNLSLEPTNQLHSIHANRTAAAMAAAQNRPSRVFFHNDSSEEELEESSVYAASSMAFGTPIEVASFASDLSSFHTSAASSVSSSSSSLALKRSSSRFSNASRKGSAARRTLVPSSHNSDLSTEVVNKAATQEKQVEARDGHHVSSVHDNTLMNNKSGQPDLGKPPVQSFTPLPSTPHATSTSVSNINKSSINVTVVRTNSSKPFKTSRPTTPLLSHSNAPYGSFDDQPSLYTPLPSSAYASSEAGFASCRSLTSFADENESELITPRPWPTLTQGVVPHTQPEKQMQSMTGPNHLHNNTNNNVNQFSREPFRRLRTATSVSSQTHSFASQRELPPLPLAPVQPLSSTTTSATTIAKATVPVKRLMSNQNSSTPTNFNNQNNTNSSAMMEREHHEPSEQQFHTPMNNNNSNNTNKNYNRTISNTQTINTPDSRVLQSAISAWDQSTFSSVTHSQFGRQGTLQSARSVDSSCDSHLVPAPLARELHYEQVPGSLPNAQQAEEITPRNVDSINHQTSPIANNNNIINKKDNNTNIKTMEPLYHVNDEAITIATPHANDEEPEEISEHQELIFTPSPNRHTEHNSAMTKSPVRKDVDNSNNNEVIVQMCTDSENEEDDEDNNEVDGGIQSQNRSGQKITPSLSPATSLHVTPAKAKESLSSSAITPLRSAQRGNQRSETKQSKYDNDTSISGAEVIEVSELSASSTSPSQSQLTPKQAILSSANETSSQLISCENVHVNSHGQELATRTNVKNNELHSAQKFVNETNNADKNSDNNNRKRVDMRQMELESVRSSRTEEELLSLSKAQQQQPTKSVKNVKANNAKEKVKHEMDEGSSNDNEGLNTNSLQRYRAPRKSVNNNNINGIAHGNNHINKHNDERPPWLGGRHLTSSSHFLNPDFIVPHHRPQHPVPNTHTFNSHTSFPSLTPIRITRATSAGTVASNTSNKAAIHLNKFSETNREKLSTATTSAADVPKLSQERSKATTHGVTRDLSKPKWAQITRISNTTAPNQNKSSAITNIESNTTHAKGAKKCKQNTVLRGVSKIAAKHQLVEKTTDNNNDNKVSINKGNKRKNTNNNTYNNKSGNNSLNKSNVASTHMDYMKDAMTENRRMSGLEFMLAESEVVNKFDKNNNNNDNDKEEHIQSNKKESLGEKKTSDKHISTQRPLAKTAKTATTNDVESNGETTLAVTPCTKVTTYTLQPPLETMSPITTTQTTKTAVDEQNELIHNNLVRSNMQHVLMPVKKKNKKQSIDNDNSDSSGNSSNSSSENSHDNNDSYNHINKTYLNENENNNSNTLGLSNEDAVHNSKIEESSKIARLVYETNAFTREKEDLIAYNPLL